MIRFLFLLIIACLSWPGPLQAQENYFESQVAPILTSRCLDCHNDSESEGDFSLQSSQAMLESGLIEKGNASDSPFMEIITGNNGHPPQMPKTGPPLTKSEIQKIRTWIDRGALWPDSFQLQLQPSADFQWWSLQPLVKPQVPGIYSAAHVDWDGNPIDAFVLQRLMDQGLTPSPPADRATLIRRLTYDLTGLPPTNRQIDQFMADTDPNAYTNLVDRLLDSPRYGEHWARHWLDVVKYADTCGYDKDKLRKNAWPYRDYIIRSFNNDKPYRQFLQEQIAGDLLFSNSPDGIIGLGFIAAGPWDFIGHVEISETKIDGMVARNLDRDDMVSNTMNTFCSVTIQCARCHDHKFDPFTQEHYYGLQAVFSAVDRAERIYQPDSKADSKRKLLTDQITDLKNQLADLEKQTHQAAGPKLADLDREIKTVQPKSKQPEFGFHSKIASDAFEEKWVEIELPDSREIDTVILHPCHDDFAGIGAGFGFPIRFRIEVDGKTMVDKTSENFENPGINPVQFNLDTRGKTVRVAATRLAERKNDFILALAELRVLGADQKNHARDAVVHSSDSTEAAPRWRKTNLVDGIWYQGNIKILEDLQQQRTDLLAKHVEPEILERHRKTEAKIAKLQAERKQLPEGKKVYAAATHFKTEGNFKPTEGQPRVVQVLHRGNIQEPKSVAVPGAIPLSETGSFQFETNGIQPDSSEGNRRALLAKWLSSQQNPLTWRSIVNRVWHYHFGRGIVDTPNDFGRMGSQPTHPELLDWLAVEFRDGGGSLKELHRMIVNSSTYRQASADREACRNVDAQNRLFWKMNRRRLSAEEIRDTILSVAGRLDLTMGGPGYYLFELEKTEHSPHYEYYKFDHDSEDTFRRSIYRFIVRSQPDPFMTTLDCADSSQSTPTRVETQTPLQALTMLNNGFNLVMAEDFADRLRQLSDDLETQVNTGIRLAYGRSATARELELMSAYARDHGLENFALILFNTSEFLFID
ncbi:MAG: PSD1 and planctomycete cytochrome C domain-containing protein [Mariniblastus sp.]|nr:PSD1 and planctomycete cytochrome C domain-containing protein [Mariniblastus sp.]